MALDYNDIMDHNLANYLNDELKALVAELGGKGFWGEYIFTFIHKKGVRDINDITTLGRDFRAELAAKGYYIGVPEVVDVFDDGKGTAKLLLEAGEGVRFEAVVMDDEGRKTLCLSCQAGCRMGCRFCATAGLGFRRDLTAGEIAGQLSAASQRFGKISNVVYMGMGEPFDNFENVIKSIEIIRDPKGAGLGQRHITVSTCGIPETIERFGQVGGQVRLALSLHGASDEVREKIMPSAKTFSVRDIMAAMRSYQGQTGRRVTIEYCMLAGVNDSPRQGWELARLVKGLKCNINLIEFNAFDGCKFKPSPAATIRAFRDVLAGEGLETAIRYKRGVEINAACGQLGADRLGYNNTAE